MNLGKPQSMTGPRTQPSAQAQHERIVDPALTKQTARTQERPAQFEHAAPRARALLFKPKATSIKRVQQRETQADAIARLEPLIQRQALAVQAELKERGLGPADVSVQFVFDLTGTQARVCTYCGRPNCDYRPENYRLKNDAMTDGAIVADEVGRRVGFNYGVVAYDDEGVAVVRELGDPSKLDGESALSRFREFDERRDEGHPESTAWLEKELSTWSSARSEESVVGNPLDKAGINAGLKGIQALHSTSSLLLLAKSQVPTPSLRGLGIQLGKMNVAAGGIAIGENADEIAASMFTRTLRGEHLHDLIESIADEIIKLLPTHP